MRKFLLLVAIAGASSAMAQLTTREAAPNSYKLGAYPQAGDLSLMFSVLNITNFDSEDDNAAANIASVNSLGRGDLITAKYYKTDNIAFRAGIKLQREVSGKSSFDSDSSSELYTDADNGVNGNPLAGTIPTVEQSTKTVVRDWAIKLGIEKHFSNSNFFDVYAGADLYLGLGKEKYENNTTTYGSRAVAPVGGNGGNGEGFNTVSNLTSSRGYTKLGVLPFIGVQMFVLDLPVSIGVEYGWDALWKFGGMWKNDVEISNESANTPDANNFTTFSDASVSGTYYSEFRPDNANALPTQGNTGQNGSAGSSMLNTNQNVKVLLNIYFGRGGSSSSDVVIE